MSLSVAVIDELARALGEDVPPELRDALVRIEAGERGVTVMAGDALPTMQMSRSATPSKAALRTRKYRERLKARAAGNSPEIPDSSIFGSNSGGAQSVTVTSPPASQSITKASPVTSHVTVGDGAQQKNFPPHPPIRKNKNTKRGVTGRHRVTLPIIDQIEISETDPIYREITAMRGGREPVVGKRRVAWVSAGEVAVAKDRMAQRVRPLRPSAVAMHSAIGPPAASGSG